MDFQQMAATSSWITSNLLNSTVYILRDPQVAPLHNSSQLHIISVYVSRHGILFRTERKKIYLPCSYFMQGE
jgi:hypothetical protein